MYLNVRIKLSDGGAVDQVVGPFKDEVEREAWQGALVGATTRRLGLGDGCTISFLAEADVSVAPCDPAVFLNDLLGHYQDSCILGRFIVENGQVQEIDCQEPPLDN